MNGNAALAALLAAAVLFLGCGSSPRTTVAEPPSPPVVEPPPPEPPPPAGVVRNLRAYVRFQGQPVAGVRVVLGAGLDAGTAASGVAHFAALDVGEYPVTLADLPAWTRQRQPESLIARPGVMPEVDVEIAPDVPQGRVVLFGDSDSSEPVAWRSTSVDDHLGGLRDLFEWTDFEHANAAEPCTSAASTGCGDRGVDQVRGVEAAVSVLRFGLNDLHYGVPVETFRVAYREILREASGVRVVVAIQAEQDANYRVRRDAYNAALVELAAEEGALYVDPALTWAGDRSAFDADGVHLDDDGTREIADAIVQAFHVVMTTGALWLPPAKPCSEAWLGFSLYGLGCADESAIRADLDWLAGLGACGPHRVWPNFQRGGESCSAYRADGSVRDERMGAVTFAAEYAASIGARLDLTLDSTKFDDLAAHKRAARDLAVRFAGHPGVAILDVCNECEKESTSYQRGVLDAASAFEPSVVSLSGQPDAIADGYAQLDVPIRAPHWPRVPGWADRVEGYARELGGLVYVQEEAREGYQGQHWSADEYVRACEGACAAGAWAYVQHSDAGFDPSLGLARDQIDDVTLEALTREGRDGCGCAR